MSTWNAGEKAPNYSLKFYNGNTTVGSVPRTEIVNLELQRTVFSEKPTVGQANAGELDATFIVPSFTIPRMAKVKVTLVYDGTTYTLGVFYIDTRETSHNGNRLDILNVHGYDSMLFAEQLYPSTTHEWPVVDTAVVQEAAAAMGVSVDPRTYNLMTSGYMIPLPGSYSIREVLGYIASMYVGSFIMTETGLLRLVSITELPEETNYLINNAGDAITFGGDRILV